MNACAKGCQWQKSSRAPRRYAQMQLETRHNYLLDHNQHMCLPPKKVHWQKGRRAPRRHEQTQAATRHHDILDHDQHMCPRKVHLQRAVEPLNDMLKTQAVTRHDDIHDGNHNACARALPSRQAPALFSMKCRTKAIEIDRATMNERTTCWTPPLQVMSPTVTCGHAVFLSRLVQRLKKNVKDKKPLLDLHGFSEGGAETDCIMVDRTGA